MALPNFGTIDAVDNDLTTKFDQNQKILVTSINASVKEFVPKKLIKITIFCKTKNLASKRSEENLTYILDH